VNFDFFTTPPVEPGESIIPCVQGGELALPVATALGANLVWFGVVTTIAIEIGLLTPPFGLSAYVIKASMDDPTMTLATIFRGALPFVLITLLVTLLLMAFPQISLALL
jgi:TRAP-type mannitol/chloroaromatic compound transport system permease large subunit